MSQQTNEECARSNIFCEGDPKEVDLGRIGLRGEISAFDDTGYDLLHWRDAIAPARLSFFTGLRVIDAADIIRDIGDEFDICKPFKAGIWAAGGAIRVGDVIEFKANAKARICDGCSMRNLAVSNVRSVKSLGERYSVLEAA